MNFILGDAMSPEVLEEVRGRVGEQSCLVIEDSAHTYDHTLAVLETYGQLVKPGGYMICEDGVMQDVLAAIDTFLHGNDEWEVDRDREWPVSWNPDGYLRRVR